MKKRLYNFYFIGWLSIIITLIICIYLWVLLEIKGTQSYHSLFFNIKLGNMVNKDDISNEQSPVFVFYRDRVIFGALKNIYLPAPNKDVLVFNYANLKDDFYKSIQDFKYRIKLFPAKNIGIILDKTTNNDDAMVKIEEVFNLIHDYNKSISKVTCKIPSLFFLDLGDNK